MKKILLVGLGLLALLACNSAPKGSLQVSVSTPAGVVAQVEVSGPGGFSQTLSASQSLSNLTPGTYTLTAKPVRKAGALVDEVYEGNSGTVLVNPGPAANFDISYNLRAGSGKLWVPVMGATKANGYAPTQLASGGDNLTPTIALGFGAGNNPYSSAVDRQGNLWFGTQQGKILMFTPAQQAASGTPTPSVEINSGSTDLNGMAFDEGGNLWVSAASSLRRFDAAQLTSSGSPTPAVAITGTAANPLSFPQAIAFDSNGALWVASGNKVYKYTPAQIASSGNPEPSVVLTAADTTSLNTPRGLAFDASGALWVANWNASNVVKFAPNQLASSGAPVPVVKISGVGVNPLRLAFDNEGNLWVSSNFGPGFVGSGHFARVAAANLVSSGTPTLAASFTNVGGFDSGGTLVFNPPPANLPIRQ
jgi:sugar lactone lactonase YvrE